MLQRFTEIGRFLGTKIGLDAPPADTVFLTESDIHVENLRQLFKAAYLKAEIDRDGDLMVTAESGVRAYVFVDEKRKFVKFLMGVGLRENRDELDKLRFLNQLNRDIVLCRYFMTDPTTLRVEYFLQFENGVTAFQIINSFRQFVHVGASSIRQLDEDDLIG